MEIINGCAFSLSVGTVQKVIYKFRKILHYFYTLQSYYTGMLISVMICLIGAPRDSLEWSLGMDYYKVCNALTDCQWSRPPSRIRMWR